MIGKTFPLTFFPKRSKHWKMRIIFSMKQMEPKFQIYTEK